MSGTPTHEHMCALCRLITTQFDKEKIEKNVQEERVRELNGICLIEK